jgi:hypothetical protein
MQLILGPDKVIVRVREVKEVLVDKANPKIIIFKDGDGALTSVSLTNEQFDQMVKLWQS